MKLFLVILAALLPVMVLAIFIYRKDRMQPEPIKWLLKAFGLGVAAAGIAMLGFLIPSIEVEDISSAFLSALIDAAIPEESLKLLMLWLIIRKNPHFDEQFDGIVYATCVGLGFAATENILYLLTNINDWVSIGIARALFAVPGHFFFAVLMGYFLSLYHFNISHTRKTKWMIWLMPVLFHGLYDGILFASNPGVNAISGAMLGSFFIFFYMMAKLAKKNITLMVGK